MTIKAQKTQVIIKIEEQKTTRNSCNKSKITNSRVSINDDFLDFFYHFIDYANELKKGFIIEIFNSFKLCIQYTLYNYCQQVDSIMIVLEN